MQPLSQRLHEGLRRFGGAELEAVADAEALLEAAARVDPQRAARAPEVAEFLREALAFFCERDPSETQGGLALDPLFRVGRTLAEALTTASTIALRRAAWHWLDLVRRRPHPALIAEQARVDEAFAIILDVVRKSRFTLGRLLEQRVENYGPRTLFRVPSRGDAGSISWLDTAARIERIARGVLALQDQHGRRPVAIFAENSLEMALADLSCLTMGVPVIMIPAPTTEKDVEYVLRLTQAGSVIFSGDQAQRRLLRMRKDLPEVQALVRLDEAPAHDGVHSLADLVALGTTVPRSRLADERARVLPSDLATIMVTSGTTGRPKAIRFSQENLVVKRFARSLALPEIGDRDVFLCYLPLFHTFGRYLEMLGTIFWGAQYVFMEDPSLDTMLERFQTYRPSVLISIPLKWIQLWEEVRRRCDVEADPDDVVLRHTRAVVGDRLRFGLSAAGYLDPEVFRFFQSQGVHLLSGFGMTEATGGITMTPPGEYLADSLGVALPGVEIKLGDDGEMLIRGPYVTIGYVEEEDQRTGFDGEWLRTGDLMERDESGHYRILDRKKEIYKNVKGQTVAPQRIEKLYVDFESVKRVFLVGDHREYNTLLIVPNPECKDVPLATMTPGQIRDHYRSIVVSVNSFLAPYERVVDFAVLERDFTEAQGELTPKGTYKRRQIADNFAAVIEEFYKQVPLRIPGREIDVKLPNRLFQALGVTTRDVTLEGDRLVIRPSGVSLTIRSLGREDDAELLQIGSSVYRLRGTKVDLGQMLTCPRLWLGNEELFDLTPMEPAARMRRRHPSREIELVRRAGTAAVGDAERAQLEEALAREPVTLEDVHLAARALHGTDERAGMAAVRLLSSLPPSGDTPLLELAHVALRSAADAPSLAIRRLAFAALLPLEEDARADDTLHRFVGAADQILLDDETIATLARQTLSAGVLQRVVVYACREAVRFVAPERAPAWRARLASLVVFLGRYGAEHPTSYRMLRRMLTRLEAFSEDADVRATTASARLLLTEGFRRWLGPPQWIAVDSETGREYRWQDVITFEEGMDGSDRERLAEAFRTTSLMREALFLLGGGQTVRLSDVPPQGIWISTLRREPDRSTYHITVHTRYQGSFDFSVGLAHGLTPERVDEEFTWAIIAGETPERGRLVEEMGGAWPEEGFWSKEFLVGDTVERELRRLHGRRDEDGVDRQAPMWPFMVWSAAAAYLELWNRTGRRYVLDDVGPTNVIVPTHDYQVGARIVSVASRVPSPGIGAYLEHILATFVRPTEALYPELAGIAGPRLVLAALIEVVGQREGHSLLEMLASGHGPLADEAREYARAIEEEGFVPRRLFFAIERYIRWIELAAEPTPRAKAATVAELYQTYNLASLLRDYPESRVRFFRETVFRDASPAIVEGLDEIVSELRKRKVDNEELVEMISAIAKSGAAGEDEEFFFTRLTFPHLRPTDTAGFVSAEWGGLKQADVVVTLRDALGRAFRVRHPVSPKEVGRLHRLFLTSKMEVTFSPEHHFLVAVNERGHLIGGLYYDFDDDQARAHLEKIVVDERYRKLGVADSLMRELFSRLGAQGAKVITTGFYRPSYFYRHGFRVERRYAGLVRTLEPEAYNPEVF